MSGIGEVRMEEARRRNSTAERDIPSLLRISANAPMQY